MKTLSAALPEVSKSRVAFRLHPSVSNILILPWGLKTSKHLLQQPPTCIEQEDSELACREMSRVNVLILCEKVF